MNRRDFVRITSLSMFGFALLGRVLSAAEIITGQEKTSENSSIKGNDDELYIEKNSWILQLEDRDFIEKNALIEQKSYYQPEPDASSFRIKILNKIKQML